MPSRLIAARSWAGSDASGSVTPPNLGDAAARPRVGSVLPWPMADVCRTRLRVVVQQQRDDDDAQNGAESGPSRCVEGETQPRADADAAEEGDRTDCVAVQRRKWTQHESSSRSVITRQPVPGPLPSRNART